MIRTALLAGIFLVLLSLAYTRAVPGLPAAVKEEVLSAQAPQPVEQPVKKTARVPAPAPVHQAAARVETGPIVEPAPAAQVAVEAPPAPIVPAPPAPAPAAPVVAQDAPKSAGQPVSLLPPEMQRPQTAAVEPARMAPAPEPAPVAAPAVAQAAAPAPPAITPAAEIPTIPVAIRTAAAPYDVPSGSAHVAVADPSAKPVDAPKFMTPQERSKELYRLAREMEDTFIHKLAR